MKLRNYGARTYLTYYKLGVYHEIWFSGWHDENSLEIINHCKYNKVRMELIVIRHYRHGIASDAKLT